MWGGNGNDALYGGDGNDTLNTSLHGGGALVLNSSELLDGGSGDDVLTAIYYGDVESYGGTGNDVYDFKGFTGYGYDTDALIFDESGENDEMKLPNSLSNYAFSA